MTAEGSTRCLPLHSFGPAVNELRSDYIVLLVAANGLPGGPSDEASDGWLREAEARAVRLTRSDCPTSPRLAAAGVGPACVKMRLQYQGQTTMMIGVKMIAAVRGDPTDRTGPL